MAVDEALVVLAEALLLAGLLVLSARLWSLRYDPYPQLVAQLLNSSPPDAEIFIALPRPVRVELSRLCRAGECYTIASLGAVYGTAWNWLAVYKRRVVLAGGAPPSPYAVLAVQVRKINYQGGDIGPAPGVTVRIAGQAYATDEEGWVNATLVKGYTYAVEVIQTSFNSGWGRYTFWGWGDGSTDNPRSVYLGESTQLAAYVLDERLLKVTYTLGGAVRVNGTRVSSGWTGWYGYGARVMLEAASSAGYHFQEWQRGVNSDALSDHSTSSSLTIAVDGGYRFHAVFDALKTFTVEVRGVDHQGIDVGPAQGVTVRIAGQTYTTDSSGRVVVQVAPGSYTVEIVQTPFNSGWGRYTFWRWSDGSTSNPRTFTLNADTTVTAYVWDERALKVTYTLGGVVKVDGAQVSSGWTNWYKFGAAVTLQASVSSGHYFAKWQRSVNADSPLSDYGASASITISVDGGYRFHAVFAKYCTFTVEVRRVDHLGVDIGPAVGAVILVNGVSYSTDSSGRVALSVPSGTQLLVQFNQQTFNSGWGRYTFWRWSDGSTSNPRTFAVAADAAVSMSVYDERMLKVTYGSNGHVRVNGSAVSSGWTSWYRFGVSVVLEAAPSSGYVLSKWQLGVNGDTLSDYSVRMRETVSGSGYGPYIEMTRTTSNAFSGYAELTLSISITPSAPYSYTYYVRISACGQHLVNDYGARTGSYSRTYTWNSNLPCSSSQITFQLYYISSWAGSSSLTGAALKPAVNPITVTADNGYHFRAEFGTP